jgi:hypothetical protein
MQRILVGAGLMGAVFYGVVRHRNYMQPLLSPNPKVRTFIQTCGIESDILTSNDEGWNQQPSARTIKEHTDLHKYMDAVLKQRDDSVYLMLSINCEESMLEKISKSNNGQLLLINEVSPFDFDEALVPVFNHERGPLIRPTVFVSTMKRKDYILHADSPSS